MWDWILQGGQVVDGSGRPARRCDVAITGDRIVAVGDLRRDCAARRLDIDGLCLAPGFIDTHTHSELALLADPTAATAIQPGCHNADRWELRLVGGAGHRSRDLGPWRPGLDVA